MLLGKERQCVSCALARAGDYDFIFVLKGKKRKSDADRREMDDSDDDQRQCDREEQVLGRGGGPAKGETNSANRIRMTGTR